MRRPVQWFFLAGVYVLLIVAGVVGLLNRYDLLETRVLFRVRDRVEGTSQEVVIEKSPDRAPRVEISEPVHVQNVSLEFDKTATESTLQSSAQSFLQATPSAQLAKKVDVYTLAFDVAMPDGTLTPVRAKVYVPHVLAAKSPLFVFASGTTGLDDRCAPTRERAQYRNWGDYHSHLLTQAADGYVVVLPDYIGFNDLSRPQAYFLAEYEARAVIGSVLALSRAPLAGLATGPNFEQIFLSGYSQGGHAAMAAASATELWDPSHKVRGIVSYAGASDVEALLSDSPRLAPYLVAAYDWYYNIGDEDQRILKEIDQSRLLVHAREKCVDEVIAEFPNTLEKIFNPQTKSALQQGKLEEVAPRFAELIRANSNFPKYPKQVPMILLQGGSDPIVTAATQQQNVKELCAQGLTLQYREYPGINHFQTRRAGYTDTAIWLKQRVSGQTAVSTCSH
jgi:dienelactone hydrolase